MPALECNNGFCLEGTKTNDALILIELPLEAWNSNSSRKQGNALSASAWLRTLYGEAPLMLIQQANHIVVDHIWYFFKFNNLINHRPGLL